MNVLLSSLSNLFRREARGREPAFTIIETDTTIEFHSIQSGKLLRFN